MSRSTPSRDRPLRVWYVAMAFPVPSEAFLAQEIRALRALGPEVTVHALRAPRPGAERMLSERGLETLRVSHGDAAAVARGLRIAGRRPGLVADLLRLLARTRTARRPLLLGASAAFLPRVLELFERAERERPDVIHLAWGHFPALLGELVLRHLPETRLSLFLGAYDLAMDYPPSAAVARRADVVWTFARVNLPVLAERGVPRERLALAYQGIDLEALPPATEGERAPRRIVCAARLVREKGVDDAIRALALLRPRFPDAELVVLGAGPDRRRLERLAERLGVAAKVRFAGHRPQAELYAELRRAGVFVLLSRLHASERLPNALKEAMAAGCVCVTTRTPGIEELVEEGRTGYVVPLGAPARAAERIAAAFAEPEAHEALRRRARAAVEARFDVHEAARLHRERWRALGAGGAQPPGAPAAVPTRALGAGAPLPRPRQ